MTMKTINPDDPNLVYSGRIDWRDRQAPVFIFPCSFVRLRIRGKHLYVKVCNRREYWDNYLGILSDGSQYSLRLPEDGEAFIQIPLDDLRTEHEVTVFKRQDGCHSVAVLGFRTDDEAEILPGEPLPTRKIEFYGDSVSAGEVSEAVSFVGRPDPPHQGEYSNSWYSYAWKTARKLHADIHDIAQGGIALLDGTGWYHEPDSQGMLSVWDKTAYNSRIGDVTAWDFSSWIPDAAVLAIGQNDSHPADFMTEDPNGRQAGIWREGYVQMLRNLRSVYPAVPVVCITTLLQHSAAWDLAIDQAISEYRKESGDHQVYRYLFRRNGRATPGHLRIPEAEEMAAELSSFLRPLPGNAVQTQPEI